MPTYRDSRDESGTERERDATSGTPRWVKVSAIAALLLVLVFVVLQLTGVAGRHGPGRHAPSGETGVHTPPASVSEGHAPPSWVPQHGEQQP